MATLIRFALTPVLGPFTTPYITFFPAVVLSAWVGGLRTGVFSVLLGAVAAALFFIPPFYSISPAHPAEMWSLVIFVVVGFGIASIGEAQLKARSRAEQATRDALKKHEILSTTMHSIGDAVIVTDRQGRITLMNALAERLTGWTEPEAMGKPCDAVFKITNETTGEVVESPIDKVLKLGANVGLANHTVLTARDGTVYPIDDSGAPIRDPAGNLHGVVLVFRDITERRKQEKTLQEAEERQRLAMDAGQVGIWDWDMVRNHITWSDRIYEFHGVEKEHFGGTVEEFAALVHPDDRARVQQAIQTAVEQGTTYQVEVRIRRPDGEVRWISTNGRVLFDGAGKPIRMLGATSDITERRRVEQELRASEARYRTMGDAVPDFIWTFQMDGKYRYVNQRWVEYTGCTLEESDAVPPDVMHHPDDYRKLQQIWEVAIAKKEPYEAEFRFRRHDGAYRWFMARAVPILDDEGNITQWIGTSTDIHERKVAEDSLRLSEERFRFALAHSNIAVYTMDRGLRYTWVYGGRASGERRELYGKTDGDILDPEDAAPLTEIKQRVLQTGVEERHTVRATYKGQTPGYYDTLFAPLRDSAGNIVGVTGTVHDITERKLATEELARHQVEIEALNAQLRRSMRETHHRVKNNLQVIAALVDMQQMQYTDHIPQSELKRLAQHITALAAIHDILTHQAQTDAGLNFISVGAVMEKLIPMIQGLVGERKITFDVQDILLPIRQSTTFTVLVNELVSNAVKHGAGQIDVRLQVQSEIATLEVQDEGDGFPADFDPVHSAHTGLDLIGSLAEMDMRGSVRYENRETGGARVVIPFPVSA